MNDRIRALRFPLIVAVIFIHSNHPAINSMSGGFLFLRDFISNGIASVAVPLFFVLSGYLFFKDLEWSRKSYVDKLKRRWHTLAIPFIFWNVFSFVYMYEIFHTVGANTDQFWFIQELMLLVVITPLFHLTHKYAYIVLSAMVTVWLFKDWSLNFPIMSSMLPMLFFYAGSVVAVKKKSLFMLDKFGVAFIALSLTAFVLYTIYGNMLVHNLGVIFGILGALYLSKFGGKALIGLSGASFFVFAYHEPIMGQILGLTLNHYAPTSDVIKFGLYVGFVAVFSVLGVVSYRVLKNISPELLGFITGGREQ